VGRGRAPSRSVASTSPRFPSICFNPLGGGAGSGSVPGSGAVHGRLLRFQSPRRWGGVGQAIQKRGLPRALLSFVSIPSEVGRGRAPAILWNQARAVTGRFQSPRRWGGVGLNSTIKKYIREREIKFQSPRRWGGVGLLRAGNCVPGTDAFMFQSPRRWGGVGLPQRSCQAL